MYYKIDDETENRVLELINKCQELELGNISFTYYSYSDINFYIKEYNTYWELIVKQQKKDSTNIYWDLTDIFEIRNNKIEYTRSEKDLC